MRKYREQQHDQNADNRWHHKEEPRTAPREHHVPEPMVLLGLWTSFAHSLEHESPGFTGRLAKFDAARTLRVGVLSSNPVPLPLALSHRAEGTGSSSVVHSEGWSARHPA